MIIDDSEMNKVRQSPLQGQQLVSRGQPETTVAKNVSLKQQIT